MKDEFSFRWCHIALISVGKVSTFAFCHLVISHVSLSCCHWLVLEPPVKAISAQLDDWVFPGTDCCFAALLPLVTGPTPGWLTDEPLLCPGPGRRGQSAAPWS